MGDYHEEEQSLEKEALEAILMDDLAVRLDGSVGLDLRGLMD